jgi:hypothetical protein
MKFLRKEIGTDLTPWKTGLLYLPLLPAFWGIYYLWLNSALFPKVFFLQSLIAFFWLLLVLFVSEKKEGIRNFFDPAHRYQWWLGAGLMLLTVMTRASFLDDYPGHNASVIEEPQTGGLAFGLLEGGFLDPEFPLTSLLAAFGLSCLGDGIEGMRWSFILWSCLGALFFYLICLHLFRHLLSSFLTTLLFTTNTYVIATGRIAMETFAPMTTLLMAIYFLLKANQHRTFFVFALAGMVNGYLFLEYISFKLMALFNCVALILCLFQQSNKKVLAGKIGQVQELSRAALINRLFLYFCLMLVVVLPSVATLGRENLFRFVEGIERNFIDGVVLPSAGKSLSVIGKETAVRVIVQFQAFFQKTLHGSVISEYRGIFDYGTGLLWLTASFYTVFGLRDKRMSGWCLFVIMTTMILGGIAAPLPERYRVFCLLPFCLFMIGVAWDDLFSRLRNQAKVGAQCMAISVCLSLSVYNVWDFFGRTIHDPIVKGENYDFHFIVSQELNYLQKTFPCQSLTLLLFNSENLRSRESRFLYDSEKVLFVNSTEEIPERGFVVICNERIEEMGNFEGYIVHKTVQTPGRGERYVVAEKKQTIK